MRKGKFIVKSQAEKAHRRRRVRTIIVSVLAVIVVVGAIWALNAKAFKVSTIEVVNNTSLETEDLNKMVEDVIEGRYFFIVPKSNALFIPVERIRRTIKRQSPEVDSVKISKQGLSQLNIEVKKRVPYVVWCDESQAKRRCFFADKAAYLFLEAPNSNLRLFPVFYGNGDGKILGTQFMEEVNFKNAHAFYSFLEEQGLSVNHMSPSGKDLMAVLDSGASIIFDPQEVDDAATNISALLSSPELTGEGFDIEVVEYVDLRYGSKVFWKTRN